MKRFLIWILIGFPIGCYSAHYGEDTQCISKKSNFHNKDGFYTLYSTLGCTLMVEEKDWQDTKIGDSVTSPYWH